MQSLLRLQDVTSRNSGHIRQPSACSRAAQQQEGDRQAELSERSNCPQVSLDWIRSSARREGDRSRRCDHDSLQNEPSAQRAARWCRRFCATEASLFWRPDRTLEVQRPFGDMVAALHNCEHGGEIALGVRQENNAQRTQVSRPIEQPPRGLGDRYQAPRAEFNGFRVEASFRTRSAGRPRHPGSG